MTGQDERFILRALVRCSPLLLPPLSDKSLSLVGGKCQSKHMVG